MFHLWGNTPVNIREQQDALDFFQAFIDQVDEQIKVITMHLYLHGGWRFSLQLTRCASLALELFCGSRELQKSQRFY